MSLDSEAMELSYPNVDQYLRSHGQLPEHVTAWLERAEMGMKRVQHLDTMLGWAEQIHRFPRVAKKLRQGDQFWETLAQLRFAWWLAQCGHRVAEFEPDRAEGKHADIRCEIAGHTVDIEITSPDQSAWLRRKIEEPNDRVCRALHERSVSGTKVYLLPAPNGSLENIGDAEAAHIADRIASQITMQPLNVGQEETLLFDDIRVLDAWTQEDNGPLRVEIMGTNADGPSVSIGHDFAPYLKPMRDNLDWITRELQQKARQLGHGNMSGIVIETTRDSELLVRRANPTPWGLDAIFRQFWNDSLSRHVDFIGLFMIEPDHPAPKPGTSITTPSLWINPSSRLNDEPDIRDKLTSFWGDWMAVFNSE